MSQHKEYFTLILYIFLNFKLIFSYSNDDCKLLVIDQNSTQVEGQVEIYYDSDWYPLCGAVWDVQDAQVACRTAGYKNGAVDFYTTPNSTSHMYYLRYSGFHCRGTEQKLSECRRETPAILVNDTHQCGGFAVAVCVANQVNYGLIFGVISGCLFAILLSIGGYHGHKYIRKRKQHDALAEVLL